ncbi:MAG: YggS family pyridoxal phosphate-dependent enzyme [Endomicrobium sp.]|jgi:pyridoxal phosphate enzyme (YggS family)|nr:YggS family pyridoxal phosphate-dependent enzyme [Endomicrobium sp.]
MRNLRENIEFVRNVVKSAENVSCPVEIIAVTKTFPYQDVLEALDCGISRIGESKIQEALPKFSQLGASLSGITKHFIGHLQTNKAKKAVENFDFIHSLDSLKLADDISRHAASAGKIQNCLIEVKVSQEDSKTGILSKDVSDFYIKCLPIPNIVIRGLMVITPCSDNPEDSRYYFRQVKSLFEGIKKSFANPNFDILSMGMSSDYKIAIEEGATMVRVGSAIFGERNYGDK